jgi:hypothetical protein
MATSHTGGCLCGAIRYEVSAPITELAACHCRDCQRASGTGGTVGARVPKAAFRLLKGTPKSYTKQADSGRTLTRFFCGDCGSPLFTEREGMHFVTIRAGSLDDSSGLKITLHIWTKSARSWDPIDPTSRQHPTQP